jgi:hypothetical protein
VAGQAFCLKQRPNAGFKESRAVGLSQERGGKQAEPNPHAPIISSGLSDSLAV